MWRYALAFLICSQTAAFLWIAIFPEGGAVEDSKTVLAGSLGILLLGGECFLTGIFDDEKTLAGFRVRPRGPILGFLIGGAGGLLSGLLTVPALRHWESLWPALLPVVLYFLGICVLRGALDREIDGR